MKLTLVMVTAEGTAREFQVPSLPVTLGRGDDAKIRIPLASISRKHCELLDDDDELIVKDLGSSNGTFVNGERIKRRELVPGDLLCVGPVVFVVKIDGFPKDIDPAASYASGSSGAAAVSVQAAIAGVPTWTGTAPPAHAEAHPAPAKPAATPSNPAPSKAASSPKPAPGKKSDDDIDSLLGDLSESDFDIDFSDLDDEKPKPGKA